MWSCCTWYKVAVLAELLGSQHAATPCELSLSHSNLRRREFLLIFLAGLFPVIIVFPAVYFHVVVTSVIFIPFSLTGGVVNARSVFVTLALVRGIVLTFFIFISQSLLVSSHTIVAMIRLKVRVLAIKHTLTHTHTLTYLLGVS